MQRKIAFRAWDGEKMSKVGAITFNADGESGVVVDDWEWLPIAKPTLMQFTGLKDKNGKEIWEGDVVRKQVDTEYGEENLDEEVTYAGGAFYPISMQPGDTFKVIGNIYSNPELLK